MRDIFSPFTDEKNQLVFCALGFFWVSNISKLTAGDAFFSRILIYPVFLLLLIVFIGLLFRIRDNRLYMNNIAYGAFLSLLVLGSICLIRGIPLHKDIDTIRSLLFNLIGSAIVWLMPLAIYFSLKGQFWLRWLPKLGNIVLFGTIYVFALLLSGIGTGNILEHKMYNSTDFLFISPFLIMLSRYKKDSKDLFIGYLGVVALVSWMFLVGERFAIAYAGLMWLFFMGTIFFEKYRLNLKINTVTLCLTFIVFSGALVSQVPIFQKYIERNFVQGEIWIDTRGGGSLSAAVTQDMTLSEKFFGKGINGTYVWGKRGWPPEPYIRSTVEIGYRQLVLKGGNVMLIAFLVLSLYAVYLAIFRSQNRITRYLAYIIIARLVLMNVAMIPRVGFEYFMYWLVVGGCLSSELRSFSDEYILKNVAARRVVIKW